ncbi:ABC transporter permease subunit [Streptacidiphilus jiangxiensis]|uniref:ABC-2 family transporter protein n=1 Tax=Streptacidiphilus jiangxiensis TaxID=235985 RepID=A0A1H8ARG6_STRJI|nr:ABC transporter permease subunit [Streptacidiphilus jiangxiensis]SEM73321.1 ABC-2 family transporter protein [Streptacidiphilus jiangxiensis]
MPGTSKRISNGSPPVPGPPVTALRRGRAVLTSEWIKMGSLRSLRATALTGLVFSVLLAFLVCTGFHSRWHSLGPETRAAFRPVDTSLGFLQLTPLLFGALGALVVTGEYGTGQIRGTFAATPQRPLVLAAKAVLLGAVGLALALITVGFAFLVGQGQLAGTAPHASLGSSGAAGALLGGALYLTLTALFGLFLGVVVRSTAVAVSTLFGLFLVLPVLVDNLPKGAAWRHTVPWLPSNLGYSLWHSPAPLLVRATPAGFALAGWVVLLAAGALASLRVRDA